MTKEALTLALEALEKYARDFGSNDLTVKAMYVVRQALAQPEQEPYAIEAGYGNGDDTYSVHIKRLPQGLNGRHKDWSKLEKLLYTTPPQRKPLSDEEISDLWCKVSNTDFVTGDTHVFARAIEAAHGIKG